MVNPSGFLLAVSLDLATLIIALSTVDASGEHNLSLVPTKSGCQGSMDECMANHEFNMDSDISSRRMLQTTPYISYGALQKNAVPCSRRGASNDNCQPRSEANPNDRG
ncbi:rapid alkalinization factor-like [Durio zibethinus]|uniref:Rapid alkalinization factor-like n=1 Tax=Durio zibethinus TaxID=66656 RepID=A0A6P5XIK3_DURZI|nr:rapid alkalinization factor-like [Durio zibethinus]